MNTWLKKRTVRIWILSIMVLFAGNASAQEKDQNEIPPNVMNAFEMLYPKIKTVSWNVNESTYEASFKLEGKAVSLVIDDTGYVNQIRNEIKQFELPLHIGELLVKEYPGWHLGKASHIDASGTAYYETVVEREEETIVLVFNREGGLLIKLIQ